MRAAIIPAAGQPPVLGDFAAPAPRDGHTVIDVRAAALSPFSKARSSGAHYSADGVFPAVAGADGVGRTPDGRRVYFALPTAPYGALAAQTVVRDRQCVALPDDLDDVTAAAIANPGMSAWAALTVRAQLRPGETVLVHGATGTAGRLAVQIARHLGAAKIIATGRDAAALDTVGADACVAFDPAAPERFERALLDVFTGGAGRIDVVLDYLWGATARAILVAIARAIDDATPVRFVHLGSAGGSDTIDLPGAALRSSAIQLMGSGARSVPFATLLETIARLFAAVGPAGLRVATRTYPLDAIDAAWQAPGHPRAVVTL